MLDGRSRESHTEDHEFVVVVYPGIKWLPKRHTIGTQEVIIALGHSMINASQLSGGTTLTTVKRK